MKHCTVCKIEKELSQFYKDKRTKSGYYSACKICHGKMKSTEKRRAENREWRKKNRKLCNEYTRRWRAKRMKTDPMFRLSSNLSSIMSMCARGERRIRWWEKIVGYTMEEFIQHIEKQFTDGMSWETYPEWEIDHIKPKSSFSYKSTDDPQFKKCWALENLRPLYKKENRLKSNNII